MKRAPITEDCSAGLMTTVLPVTRAATVMPQRMASGKFQGAMMARDPSWHIVLDADFSWHILRQSATVRGGAFLGNRRRRSQSPQLRPHRLPARFFQPQKPPMRLVRNGLARNRVGQRSRNSARSFHRGSAPGRERLSWRRPRR